MIDKLISTVISIIILANNMKIPGVPYYWFIDDRYSLAKSYPSSIYYILIIYLSLRNINNLLRNIVFKCEPNIVFENKR